MTGSACDTPAQDAAWFDVQYDNRRRVPAFAQHITRWRRRLGAGARAARLPSRHPVHAGSRGELGRVPGRTGGRAGARVHPRRLLAFARQGRLLVRRAALCGGRCDGRRAELLAVPGRHRSIRSRCRWRTALAWVLRHAADHGGNAARSSWPATRRAGIWPPCCWPAMGGVWRATCRSGSCAVPCRFRACIDLEPIARAPSCRSTCG